MTVEIVVDIVGREKQNMNKPELITKIVDKTELDKKQALAAMDAILSTITEALKTGEKISLPGFGTFEVRTRAARTGKNPRTGEAVEIAEKKVPAFKPGKALKEVVDKAASN